MSNPRQIECVVMDWAGTAIDFGCFAPVDAFQKAFEEIAVEISTKEIRLPMGLAKIEHIRQLLRMEQIHHTFQNIHHREWNEDDVVRLNRSFEKHLLTTLTEYTNPIPHVVETISILRKKEIKIGSTTGYTRAMMDVVEPSSRSKGYCPDHCATPDGLPKGRPAPFMIFQNLIALNVQSMDCVVKIGDTMEDIREGLNAKVWTVGVIIGSSELGLSEIEIQNMPEMEFKEQTAAVRRKMTEAGAHYVVDSMAELPRIIDQINARLVA